MATRALPVRVLLAGIASALLSFGAAGAEPRLPVGPAELASVLATRPGEQPVQVPRFELDRLPVTNAQFLAFVRAHPQWQRGRVPALFADGDYLSHWRSPDALGADALPGQPVTRVSWHAARAYCEAAGGRLPEWNEWELAAAADERLADARSDPAWRERILDWYSRPATQPLAPVGQRAPDAHGIQDLHGLVWEWVEDFNALLVSGDSREQGDADKLRFCGAGALGLEDKDNFAVLMRVAFLSALEADSTARSLGFRCATRDASLPPVHSPSAPRDAPVGNLPGGSLAQLDIGLEASDGEPLRLAQLRGAPLLVTMFYSQCTSVCPLLTSQLQGLVRELPPAARARARVLMVSFDSERDTPQVLEAYRARHHVEGPRWIVAHAPARDVRTLAAALGIRYRELPDHSFNHTAVLTLLDADGVPRARTQLLAGRDAAFMATVTTLLGAHPATPAQR